MTKPVARDPRIDPKPGDVLMLEHGVTLGGIPIGKAQSTIQAVDDYGVHGASINARWNGPFACAKSQWANWSKDAEVIHRAE